MNKVNNIHVIINGERASVEASVSSILHAARQIENALIEETQNVVVFAADAYNWDNGHTTLSIGIRLAERIGGREKIAMIDDTCWLIAGTLRRIDNDQEIIRIRDLYMVGCNNAYIELRAQASICGSLSNPKLGKRKIVNMQMVGETAYLSLAPMTN